MAAMHLLCVSKCLSIEISLLSARILLRSYGASWAPLAIRRQMAQAIPSSIHCTTAWEFYMVVTRGRDAIVCTKIGAI